MTSLSQTFENLKTTNRVALIPFLTAGYPNQKTFEQLLFAVIEAGADIAEVGIPFSDPLADGPTIQFSSHQALKDGTTLSGTLAGLRKLSPKIHIPLVVMSYFNPIREYRLDHFFRSAYKAGVRGLIVPDMIIEESDKLEQAAQNNKKHRIDLIHLLAPTSGETRTQAIVNRSRGFVYLVSVAGVTGSRKGLPPTLSRWTRSVAKLTDKPLCVGFGISSPKLAAEVARFADGVIIGSAIIDIIRKANSGSQAITRVGRFITKVRKAIDDTRC